MRSFVRPLVAAIALAAATATAYAQHAFADVSGKWRVELSMGDRATESLLTLKQAGDTLSGTIESEQVGTRPLEGMMKGDTVRFNFSVDMQGNVLAISVGGVLKDKDTMSGEFALPNGMGTFPFSAKRQP